ncbi:MAG TPA: DUF481 domain-containing protein [Oligoflexus sp.]|uniref:DUF481 domain-containing protein n=1 Tax=Oligoflexus sp. TaxID=1971216 RepID=UPI002D33F210|nr:DUF481 domain-containing protein [Oligoflexus sp.]HYX34737.1 DUF481 domain-containing protein [Oligoflexus sp.]
MSFGRVILFLILGSQPLLAQESSPSPWTYEEPTLTRDNPKPFGLKIEYGQNHSAGKSSYLSRVGKLGAKYENGLDEVRLNADGSSLRTLGQTVDDRRHYFLGYDRYIGSRLWLFLLHDWESNEVVGLNYTQLSGAGVKVDLMRNKVYTLNVGVAYLKRAKQTEYNAALVDANNQPYTESRVSTKDDKVISARLKFDYETDLVRLSLISFYQPVTQKNINPVSGEKKDDYSWSVESSIAYHLTKQVYLRYAYLYRFEALQTAPGAARKDEKTTLQVGYEF